MPIFLGYVPVGAAFGILARTMGFSVLEAAACSATALAGAGQFIALSVLASGAGAAAVLAATAIVNLRYVLFASTLSPYLKGVSLVQQAMLGFSLTDETFAVNIADRRAGRSTVSSMAGVGFIAWCGWVLGTVLGAAAAGVIGDPKAWGVDFAMPAMFVALFVALSENRRHVITGILSGAIALALPLLARVHVTIPPAFFIVIASVAGATIASVVYRDA